MEIKRAGHDFVSGCSYFLDAKQLRIYILNANVLCLMREVI
jgi:hypothetical protein